MPDSKITDAQVLEALKRCRGIRAQAARLLNRTPRWMNDRVCAMRGRGIHVPESQYDGRMARMPMPDPPPLSESPDSIVAEPEQDPACIDKVRQHLKPAPATLERLAADLGATRGQILAAIDALRAEGLNLHEHSGTWHWERAPAPGHTRTDLPMLETDEQGWLTFGFTSDNHLCSKYSRLDVLTDLYDRFAEEGISLVLNAGNWVDGEAQFNRHDLLVHGMDSQLRYLAEHYPQRPGMITYAVAGDDHEGWYAQREGVDIGRLAQQRMRDAGREDWIDVGYMEAFFRLRHRGTGEESRLHLMHPGGGSAYAESYTVQKVVEGYDGGEKPAVLLAGHYHKLSYNCIRNVHCVQTGCTQDQTPFARKKKIRFALGGGIARLRLDERGAVIRFRVEFFNYFVRGYYNNSWSHSGPVTLPERGKAAA